MSDERVSPAGLPSTLETDNLLKRLKFARCEPLREAIASDTAVSLAKQAVGLQHISAVTAESLIVSDDEFYVTNRATGETTRVIQNRHVWLVTLKGVNQPSRGPAIDGVLPDAFHMAKIPIDQRTGDVLMIYFLP